MRKLFFFLILFFSISFVLAFEGNSTTYSSYFQIGGGTNVINSSTYSGNILSGDGVSSSYNSSTYSGSVGIFSLSSSCTGDSSCAASTCTGSTCTDSCGNVYAGTKDCSTTGGGGGGGGSSTVTVTNLSGLELDRSFLSLMIKQGEYQIVTFSVSNPTSNKITVNVNSDLPFIDEQQSFSLAPKSSKTVSLRINAGKDLAPDDYIGNIFVVSSATNKSIKLNVQIVSVGYFYEIELQKPVEEPAVVAGQYIPVNISLTRLIPDGLDRIELNYIIKNELGIIVQQYKDVRAITEGFNFTQNIKVPDSLNNGRYLLYVQVLNGGKISSADMWFSVLQGEKVSAWMKWVYFVAIMIGVVIAIVIFFLVLKLIHRRRHRRMWGN